MTGNRVCKTHAPDFCSGEPLRRRHAHNDFQKGEDAVTRLTSSCVHTAPACTVTPRWAPFSCPRKGVVTEARGQGRLLLMGRAPARGSKLRFVQQSTDLCFELSEPRGTFRQLRPVTLIGSDWGWRNEVGTKGWATAVQGTPPQSRWEPRQCGPGSPLPRARRNVWSLDRGSLSLPPLRAGPRGHRKAPPHPAPLQK